MYEELSQIKNYLEEHHIDFEEFWKLTTKELDYIRSRSKKNNIPFVEFLEVYILSKHIGSVAYLKLKLKGYNLS
jgi:cephalosporin-C deacetylase-like acetyl esterase